VRYASRFSATHAALGADLESATTGYGADVGCSEPMKVLPLAETFSKNPKLSVVSPPSRLRRFGGTTFAYILERRLVENTGLEPVTSWLQTRRSPS
jgi:hypothetical protein